MAWASGLSVSRWAKELAHEIGKEIYFSRFMGDSFSSMIVSKSLESGKGQDITFGMVGLTGAVVTGDSSLEGNEDSLTSYSQTVTTSQRRFGVINTGNFDDSKVLYNFRNEALQQLKRIYAEDIDAQMFSSLTATTGTHQFLRADATASVTAVADPASALAAADSITLSDISKLKRLALVGGTASHKMKPIRVDGKEYFVLILHPSVTIDLVSISAWQDAQGRANTRGSDNPLFTGALGVWDGVVLHEHDGITTSDVMGGGSILGARNLFCGAGAGLMGEVGSMSWVEKTFDYGNKLGVAAGKIYGTGLTYFNSKDYGVIQYMTSRPAL